MRELSVSTYLPHEEDNRLINRLWHRWWVQSKLDQDDWQTSWNERADLATQLIHRIEQNVADSIKEEL